MTPAEARALIAEGARHEPHLAGPPSSIAYAAARRWIEGNLVRLLAGYAEALDEIVGLKLGMPLTEALAEIERLRQRVRDQDEELQAHAERGYRELMRLSKP